MQHLLRIGEGPPAYLAALLLSVASEALSRLAGRRKKDAVFYDVLLDNKKIGKELGEKLFDAVRNGLAHAYDTKTFVIEGQEFVIVVSWKHYPHLKVICESWLNGRPGICLNVHEMWERLDTYLTKVESEMQQDAALCRRVQKQATQLITIRRMSREAHRQLKGFVEREMDRNPRKNYRD